MAPRNSMPPKRDCSSTVEELRTTFELPITTDKTHTHKQARKQGERSAHRESGLKEDANFPVRVVVLVALEAAVPDYPQGQHGRHAHTVAELAQHAAKTNRHVRREGQGGLGQKWFKRANCSSFSELL